MKSTVKTTLIALAAGAFGVALVGCGGAQGSSAEEPSSAGEAMAGEGSCGGKTEAKEAEGGEAGCAAGEKKEAEGGESSCGAGSCGGSH